MTRGSVVLPQPEGPRRVKSSPSSMAKLARLTTTLAPKRLVSPRTEIRIRLALEVGPDRLDLLAEARVHRLVALLRRLVVVDVRHVDVEIGAQPPGELDRHLGTRSRRALAGEGAPRRGWGAARGSPRRSWARRT